MASKTPQWGAFGGSHPGAHSNEEIWGLTAFIRQMSSITPEQYRDMSERAIAKRSEQGAHQPIGRDQHTAPQQQAAPQQQQTDSSRSAAPPHKH